MPAHYERFQAWEAAHTLTLAIYRATDNSPTLVSSRLLEYELWNRLHARKLATSHAEAARLLLARLAFLELSRPVLYRATQPFPVRVRTLDALHLASAVFLREAGQAVTIASYDRKLLAAAKALEFDTVRDLR